MPETKRRYVAACQQALAVGTAIALASPAVGVVTLDIVAPAPGPEAPAADRARPSMAVVAGHAAEPEVTEVPVPATGTPDGSGPAALSRPTEVSGLATVGVTWDRGEHLGEDEVTVSVRSLDAGTWGPWEEIEYHDDHGPDPGSPEARHARPGTDPVVVGDVDEVQVKIETGDGDAPRDATLAVVDPQETPDPHLAEPAIDTARLPEQGDSAPPTLTGSAAPAPVSGTGAATLAGAAVTSRPRIFSRAQWGADESLRDRASLSYFEVHAGFVHHTVNANGYSRADVPALLRGIYAYHTRSRGWSDIGYNFVVDRFGRIWEGRYGGVDRPVVGAHTLGYNEYSFGAAALGNFETAAPSRAMLRAYGRLFAWKLALHGIPASSRRRVGRSTLPAVSGHRDAGQTACPGRYLYDRLRRIRNLASGRQLSFAGRDRRTDLAGSRWPDVAVRDRRTRRVYLLRTGGQTDFRRPGVAAPGWGGKDLIAAAGDLTGDGRPDVIARDARTKVANVHPGTSRGGLGAPRRDIRRFTDADLLTGVGDWNRDGAADVVARMRSTKALFLYPGNGGGGFRRRILLARDFGAFNLVSGVGDLDGDRRPDLVARAGRRLFRIGSTGRGLAARVRMPARWGGYSTISGAGDLTNDGRPDIVVQVRSSRKVHVLPGNGRGGLAKAIGPFGRLAHLNHLQPVGRLTGGPGVDLLGRNGAGRMVVYRNNGLRNVDRLTNTGLVVRSANLLLNVGDWDGDGHGDLMTRVPRSGDLFLWPGDGRGRFRAPVRAATGWKEVAMVVPVGDITGDGNPDLMGQPAGRALRIYPGDGSRGFRPSYVAHSALAGSTHLGVGLWDGDGSPDTAVRRANGTLHLYRGNGPGGLMTGRRIGAGAAGYDWLESVADATGDGRPDLFGRDGTGRMWLLPGTAAGFGAPRVVSGGFARFDLSSLGRS